MYSDILPNIRFIYVPVFGGSKIGKTKRWVVALGNSYFARKPAYARYPGSYCTRSEGAVLCPTNVTRREELWIFKHRRMRNFSRTK